MYRLLGEYLEVVALRLQPAEALREGGTELVDRLEGVVEGDDRAVAGVFLYIVHHVLGCKQPGVVAGDEIPHHYLVLTAEPGILVGSHPAVGRTHVVAVDIGIGLLHVVAVLPDGMAQTDNVVVGVVAHLMAFIDNLLIELRVLAHVVAHHEECCLYAVLPEHVEDEWRCLRDGAVVEGQVDCLLVTVHPPVGFRIEPAEVDGGLLNNHRQKSFVKRPASGVV